MNRTGPGAPILRAADLEARTRPPLLPPASMPLATAHKAALRRAWLYGDEPCVAATAWTQVATHRRTRVTHPHFFHEAFADACASEDPHLILAVQTIALDHAERCEGLAADRAGRIAHEIRIATGLSVPS